MSDQNIDIQPVVITETKNVAKISIRINNVELFKSVSISVMLLDADNNYCGVRNINIEQPEYENWTSDDSTLVAMVLQKLGFSPATVVQTA
jgi:fibrillarin-like rRNA methylase